MELDFTRVRRRLEFILETRAGNSVAQMVRDTGLPRNVVNNALNSKRQNLSQSAAVRLCETYEGCTLDFLYRGRRSGLGEELQKEIDNWIVAGRWDVCRSAPAQDRQKLR